eukprot:833525-Pelagomonas_calceolata.AAC.2
MHTHVLTLPNNYLRHAKNADPAAYASPQFTHTFAASSSREMGAVFRKLFQTSYFYVDILQDVVGAGPPSRSLQKKGVLSAQWLEYWWQGLSSLFISVVLFPLLTLALYGSGRVETTFVP